MKWFVALGNPGLVEVVQVEDVERVALAASVWGNPDVDAVVARYPDAELVAGPIESEERAQALAETCRAWARGERPNDGEDALVDEGPEIPIVRMGAAGGSGVQGSGMLPRVKPTQPSSQPRNRKERRQAARLAKKLAAAPKRLAYEDRYTQAAELAETRNVRDWSDLDDDDRQDVLEQAGQSHDRW